MSSCSFYLAFLLPLVHISLFVYYDGGGGGGGGALCGIKRSDEFNTKMMEQGESLRSVI